MAYTDLVSSQTTFVAGGSTYNFAFDSPISSDNSPHISTLGLLLECDAGVGVIAADGGLADIITDLRVKVGSNIIMNWNNNATKTTGNAAISQFAVLIQRLGGQNYCASIGAGASTGTAEVSWPVGLDASRSHRINVSVTLSDEALNMAGVALTAATQLNMSLGYGVSSSSLVVGSRQDFTMTANATRAITVSGKKSWEMLGVFCADSDAGVMTADLMTEARVNNGAFRELSVQQWRALNNSYSNPDRTALFQGGVPDTNADGMQTAVNPLASQACSLFLNLRRLTAGANADIVFTYGAVGSTLALYPIWVADIGQSQGAPTRQNVVSVSNPTSTVETNQA